MAACDLHGRLSPDGALLATWYRPDFSIVVDPMDMPPEVVADEAAWLARFDTLPAEVTVHELDTGVERYRTELAARTRITDFDGRFLVVAPCRVHDAFSDCPLRYTDWTIIDTSGRQPPITLKGAVVLLRMRGSGPLVEANPATLRRSDRGPWVSFLQQALVADGQAIEVDGIFGPATEAAVRHVQMSADTDVDGIAGPATWAALFRDVAAWDEPLPLATMPGFGTRPVDVSPSGIIIGGRVRDCVGPNEYGTHRDCVWDVVVWDGVAAGPRVLRRDAYPVGINARDQVLVSHEDGAEVIDVDTGATMPMPNPPGVVRVRGREIGDDLVFGDLIIREADPDVEFSSPETEGFVFDLRSGTLGRIETGGTYGELVESGLSVRDQVLLGLNAGVLVVPSLDIPDEFGPGEVFGWAVDARGRVYGTSTYPAPAGCHTDFPCRRVYAWDPASGTLEDLGTPGSQHPHVNDVNDVGQIVVHDSGPDHEHASVPWVWDPDARTWNELPCPADQSQCQPTAIGADGTVYGHVLDVGAVHWPPASD